MNRKSKEELYPKVLVVDDDYMNIEVLVAMLKNRGVESDIAINGK